MYDYNYYVITGVEVQVGDHENLETSQNQHQIMGHSFLSYIFNTIKSLETGSTKVDTSALIHNLCVAVVLQLQLMEECDDNSLFLKDSLESYEAICSLTTIICVNHYKGMYYIIITYSVYVLFVPLDVEAVEKKTGHDLHAVVLQNLIWWTCHSEIAASGLSKTGIITVLVNMLRHYVRFNIVGKVCQI